MASTSGSAGLSAIDNLQKLEADAAMLRQQAQNMTDAELAQHQQALQSRLALLNDHLQRPATIHSIEVHGAKNTRKGFLDPLFAPLVDPARNADTTLGEVLAGIQEVTDKLARFEIFHPEPSVFLSDARASDPHAAGTDMAVSIRVAEKSRFLLKTGTELGNTEGSGYINMLWRNMFGGAEQLSINTSAGTRTRSSYTASLSAPLQGNPDVRVSLEAQSADIQKSWASHEEVSKGATLRTAWLSPTTRDLHNLAYSSTWRQVTGLSAAASPTVRADAGDSMKSALTYTFTRDRRDNPMLPQSGYLVKTITELAGLGPLRGDVAFYKSEVELAGAMPLSLPRGLFSRNTDATSTTANTNAYLPSRASIGGGFRCGWLWPLPLGWSPNGTDVIPSLITDRFQLGGPTDVRGFKIGGLGPRDGNDSVGGDLFAAGSINMLLPLPRTSADSPLRLQLFANAGRLVALENQTTARETESKGLAMSPRAVRRGMAKALAELGNGLPSCAAGFGLVYAAQVARFELNFSLPLVLRKGEQARKGVSVGVGIDFM
ncbi:sorting assembly machinery 50 kDa subunit [Coniella lustricola]|uniref:Sorting assembly machinery 50 kDa subunit n=1 Tax=Coniella lustricola TaxID=2025994 RepID=A0A2T3A752_9PEZI|nr:sorting assembly machinery 50 kDa subunit [Coniella lustricola]